MNETNMKKALAFLLHALRSGKHEQKNGMVVRWLDCGTSRDSLRPLETELLLLPLSLESLDGFRPVSLEAFTVGTGEAVADGTFSGILWRSDCLNCCDGVSGPIISTLLTGISLASAAAATSA